MRLISRKNEEEEEVVEEDPVPWNSIADGDACWNEAYAGTRDDGNGWVQGKASEMFAGLFVQDYLKDHFMREYADGTCCLDKSDYVLVQTWEEFKCKSLAQVALLGI